MSDHDIYAFGAPTPVSAAASTAWAPAASPRRRWWPWVLAGLLVLTLLAMAALTMAIAGLADAAHEGWHVVVNGHEWDGLDLGGLTGVADGLGGVIGVSMAMLVLIVVVVVVVLVVPVLVLLALLAAGGGVGMALCAVLLALALVAAVVLSPLWLLWLLLRRRPQRVVGPQAAGARMSA